MKVTEEHKEKEENVNKRKIWDREANRITLKRGGEKISRKK